MEKYAYTLRLKNTPLISFDLITKIDEQYGVPIKTYELEITKVQHRKNLPIPLQEHPTNSILLDWIKRRKAPKNRQYVNKILKAIDDSDNPMRYVTVSHALSLNDAFWITNDAFDEKWEDFNLYHHKFNELLAHIAFTGYGSSVKGPVSSPELTSRGALKKCWSNRADGIYLLKGDDFIKREDGRSQATMEYYAAQIAKAMGFPHIDYDLDMFHHADGEKEIICMCKLFTSENKGYVDAYWFFRHQGLDVDALDITQPAVQMKMADVFGAEAYADLMVYDALILNQDRHLGNFGYLINNNTGEFIKPAPLFDNGFSLVYGASNRDLTDIRAYADSIEGKYLPFDQAAQLFLKRRHIKKIRSLLNFSFEKHPKWNVSNAAWDSMNKLIRYRAQRLLEIAKTIDFSKREKAQETVR